MRLIEVDSAAEYLRSTRRIAAEETVEVTYLSGGVSNVVLHVRRPKVPGGDFVLKQARPQLRVPLPWFCSVERIWREVAVLRLCDRIVGEVSLDAGPAAVQVPRVVFEDRESYAFAMTAAPLGHTTWKQRLLDGNYQPEIAAACGTLLGRLHAATWHDADVARRFDDRQFFDDLRVDPYYRQVARVHPDRADAMARLVESVWNNRHCLVHGDFSPKNLLVWAGGLMLIDFEVGHYGDPAFDLGFFLSHLVLKSYHAAARFDDCFALTDHFWRAYHAALSPRVAEGQRAEVERRGIANLAGCLLARVDGKSRVDYLANTAPVRRLARQLLVEPAGDWAALTARIRRPA